MGSRSDPDGTNLGSDSVKRRRVQQAAVFAVIPVFVVVLAWTRRWMSDDGFIYLRVVRNVLAGNGPVYNAGERMETATDPVWVGLVSIAKLVVSPVSLEYVTVFLGLVFMAAALIIAQITGFVMWRRHDQAVLVPFGLIVVAGVAAYWDFTTGGLDTALVLLWLSASFGLVALMGTRGLSGWALWAAAVVLGLGFLIRPDLVPYAVALTGTALWIGRGSGWRHSATFLAVAGALPGIYMIFRMGYFGAVIPAPAIAKGASRSDWGTGLIFVVEMIATYKLIVPMAALLVAGWWFLERDQGWLYNRPLQVLTAAMYGAAVVQVLFIVRLGGGFMHARLLLPALFVLVLPLAVIPWRRSFAMAPWAVVVVWALVSAVGFRAAPFAGYIADERAFYVRMSEVDHPVTLSDHPVQWWAMAGLEHGLIPGTPSMPLLALPVDGESLNFADGPVFSAIPVIPGARVYSPQASIGMYAFTAPLDLHVVDRFGLADPIASRLTLETPGRPGHSKVLPLEWVVARFAGEPVDLPYLDSERILAAKHALTCKPIAELIAAKTEPLTLSRFWENLIGAPSRTLLRIPPDPVEAVQQHCATAPVGSGR